MLTMPPEPKSVDIPMQISHLQTYKEVFLEEENVAVLLQILVPALEDK